MKVEAKFRSLEQSVTSGFAAVLDRLAEKAPQRSALLNAWA